MSNKIAEYFLDGVNVASSIIKGHIVTFKNLFRKKSTMQYPEVRWELPVGYRGVPSLPVDIETGKDRCIGCGACVRICPTQLITVDTHTGDDKKKVVDDFHMDIKYCMFCGLCAEVCPVSALIMSKEYELAEFDKDCFIYNRERLNEIGGVIVKDDSEPETGGTDDTNDN